MASPVLKNFTQAVLSDTGTVAAPSDTSIGDLVVIFVWSQFTTTATTHTAQAGYTTVRTHSHNDGTTCGRLSVATKVATAAGAQSYVPYTIANATAGQTCVGLITVTGANTNAPNAWISASATDTSNAVPNPPSLTGLNSDVLVLAIAAWQVTTAGSTSATGMANYTLNVNGPTGSHVTHLAVASRGLTGLSNATEDPAAYGDNVTPNGTVAMTIAIPITATYYVTTIGNDSNVGTGTSAATAWKTINAVNSHVFVPGDIVLFNGGETFTGGIYIHDVASGSSNPIIFDSYGTGRATISSAVGSVGIYVYKMAGVSIQDLNLTGPGIATANKEGILFYNDAAGNVVYPYIRINNCTITGYTQGISIGGGAGTSGYSDVRIENCICNNNSRNGIQTYGAANYALATVYIGNCTCYSNPGLTGQSSPTGSGFELGRINGGTVELCLAYSNGATQNAATGPFGIWAYSSNNVTIQSCESYNNTSAGGDGGGFDLDGGCTNCIIQYCYSHGNKGAGFAMYQYLGAATFSGNTIRYNISESDGSGLAFWGASATDKITNSSSYNNTVYASIGPAVDINSANLTSITVINNILLTTGGVALVDDASTVGITFNKNNYYPLSGAFLIWWGGTSYASLAAWGQDAGGLSVNPMLTNPGAGGTIGNAANLPTLTAYKISDLSSPMVNAGATITSPGSFDFWGDALYSGAPDIGADECYLVAGQPTMRRWGGVPQLPGGQLVGRTW